MTVTIDTGQILADIDTAVAQREFSYHDRCDRCHYQAYFVAQKPHPDRGIDELVFCNHHGKLNVDALFLQGWDIYDYTDRLIEVRTLEEEPVKA